MPEVDVYSYLEQLNSEGVEGFKKQIIDFLNPR